MNILVERINPFSHFNIQQREEYEKIIGMRGEFTVDIDSAILSEDALDILLGTKETVKEQGLQIDFETSVQVKRHKKKRINKKWAKRYGYKKEIVSTDGWFFSEDATTGTVEMWRYGDKKKNNGR